MIRHLSEKHNICLPLGLDESLFDGGFDQIKEELKGALYREGKFYN